jgi:regulator of RNase E activity RraA
MIFNSPERVAALTPLWDGPRLEDGRPKVDDDILERMKAATNDEVWSVLEKRNDYHFNFEGEMLNLHPDVILSGRAVTAQFVPRRPDLEAVVMKDGEGRNGGQNTWIIDQLQPGDVLVVDLFGKIEDGTFIGDNLATAIRRRTGTGIVIQGGIRDYQRIDELEDFAVFFLGQHPSAILDVTLVGVNIPVLIGGATVMPGDVVLGTPEGLSFIPPHLAEEVVNFAEETAQRDVFGKWTLDVGKYKSSEIDVNVWADHIESDYKQWCADNGHTYKPKNR